MKVGTSKSARKWTCCVTFKGKEEFSKLS